jgi:hypothetical protein
VRDARKADVDAVAELHSEKLIGYYPIVDESGPHGSGVAKKSQQIGGSASASTGTRVKIRTNTTNLIGRTTYCKKDRPK